MSEMRSKKLGFATRAVHAALRQPEVVSRAIATPIFQTAAFAFDDVEGMSRTLSDTSSGFMYSRISNPTTDVLERAVADLEGAEAAAAFGSGMAAVHASILAFCGPGDHIVAPSAAYGNSLSLLKGMIARLGIKTTFVESADPAAWRAAITPKTKIVYAESIANPALTIADVPALATIAREAKATFVIDSTFASPWLLRPIEHGADVVLHSATKYLNGHGDVIAGVVAGSKESIAKVRRVLIDAGGMIDPFAAFLVLRGMKTLSLRMERHCASALKVAQALSKNRKVSRVIYPGLETHPQHALAKKLLPRGFGGMVCLDVAGGREGGLAALHKLEIFLRAGSLGDAHSLAVQPSTTSHRTLDAAELAAAGISEGFLRLSIGLEDADDLIADLEQALG
jgi:O-acetylhomoserine/O-acetylserine sulfhydrylase-like pyridoxal-dependent enzyme